MCEIGASEGEKSILIAFHESNSSQFRAFLKTGSWFQSKHNLSEAIENKNPFL